MSTLALAPESPPAPRHIAPLWHTIVLVLSFLVMAAGGAIVQQRAAAHATTLPTPSRPTALYLSLIAMEWGLVLYVVRVGLRRTGDFVARGGGWPLEPSARCRARFRRGARGMGRLDAVLVDCR